MGSPATGPRRWGKFMPVAAVVPANGSSFAARRGFPPLTGSPAQIQWAEKIRERLISGLDRQIRSGQGASRTTGFQSTKEWWLTHTEARWWIDNRDKKPTTAATARYAEIIDIYGSLLGKKKPVRAL